jgi:hypothetical protein
VTPREAFHSVMGVGLIFFLVLGIAQGKTTAIVASSVGLLATALAFAQEYHARRQRREKEG